MSEIVADAADNLHFRKWILNMERKFIPAMLPDCCINFFNELVGLRDDKVSKIEKNDREELVKDFLEAIGFLRLAECNESVDLQKKTNIVASHLDREAPDKKRCAAVAWRCLSERNDTEDRALCNFSELVVHTYVTQ